MWNELKCTHSNQHLIETLQILESTCSSFRKCRFLISPYYYIHLYLFTTKFSYSSFSVLRFGRCADSLHSALTSIHYPDPVLKFTLTLGKIANSLFLFADHIVWLSRTGLMNNVDSNKWVKISNKYWLLNLIMNLVRDFYEIKKFFSEVNITDCLKNEFAQKPFSLQMCLIAIRRIFNMLLIREDILVDTVKNFCDIWIPLSGLQKVKLRPSIVGLLGTISSLAAIITLVKPLAKLSPA